MHSPHEMVSIPRLLALGGLVQSEKDGWAAIRHGRVAIERWCIGLPEGTLPRWVLRGVTIRCGDRSMRIAEDGTRIRTTAEAQLR